MPLYRIEIECDSEEQLELVIADGRWKATEVKRDTIKSNRRTAMARLLADNGTEREVRPANGQTFTLKELQALVGGYVQCITLQDGSMLLMDEDGKMKGKTINLAATAKLMGMIALDDEVVGDVLHVQPSEMD